MCFRPATASTPKTCPVCGMTNPSIAERCVKCKAELPEDRVKCPHCGEMNIAGAMECSECRSALAPSAGGAPAIPVPTAPSIPKAPDVPTTPPASAK